LKARGKTRAADALNVFFDEYPRPGREMPSLPTLSCPTPLTAKPIAAPDIAYRVDGAERHRCGE